MELPVPEAQPEEVTSITEEPLDEEPLAARRGETAVGRARNLPQSRDR